MKKYIGDYYEYEIFDWDEFGKDLVQEVAKQMNAEVMSDGNTNRRNVVFEGTVRQTGKYEFGLEFGFDNDIYVDEDDEIISTIIDWNVSYEQPLGFEIGFGGEQKESALDKVSNNWYFFTEGKDGKSILVEDEDDITIRDLPWSTTMTAYASTIANYGKRTLQEQYEKAFSTQDDLWIRE